MFRVGVYDQIKSAFQDIIAPELHAMRGQMRVMSERITALDQKIAGVDNRLTSRIDGVEGRLLEKFNDLDIRLNIKIDGLRAEMISTRNELISEIRRLDTRIDGVDRELHAAIDIRERLAALEARRQS
jgi:hypothetical protein